MPKHILNGSRLFNSCEYHVTVLYKDYIISGERVEWVLRNTKGMFTNSRPLPAIDEEDVVTYYFELKEDAVAFKIMFG